MVSPELIMDGVPGTLSPELEGNLPEGAQVVVVEDVVTTGSSTIKAIERLKAHGCSIQKVLALVDRQEGGREAIEATRALRWNRSSPWTIFYRWPVFHAPRRAPTDPSHPAVAFPSLLCYK